MSIGWSDGAGAVEVSHFQEDQEFKEAAMLSDREEQGESPFPCSGFWFYSRVICTRSLFGKAALLKPFIEVGWTVSGYKYVWIPGSQSGFVCV